MEEEVENDDHGFDMYVGPRDDELQTFSGPRRTTNAQKGFLSNVVRVEKILLIL